MTIGEVIRQGLHYARTCKSLWLFGFFVGMASGGSGAGGGGSGNGSGGSGWSLGAGGVAVGIDGPFNLSVSEIAPVVVVIVMVAGATLVMRFVGEGALIEG